MFEHDPEHGGQVVDVFNGLVTVVLSGGPTTLKLFSAGGFKNFNIINPRIIVKIDTKARPYGLKVYCDALMIHATE